MTQSVTRATYTVPAPAKASLKSAMVTFEIIANPQVGTGEIALAAERRRAAPGSIRPCWVHRRGDENRLPAGMLSDPLHTKIAGIEQNISRTNESSRLGRVSLAVGDVRDIDVEACVKTRMLRELAAWYRTLATRAGNPVMWESRLLTAADLDAEASRIEKAGICRPTL